MPFAMAALNRSKSGAYTARKGIPKDVQGKYERLYGYRWEAKLTLPASLKPAEAKAQYAEWLTEVERRIDTIRSRGAAVADRRLAPRKGRPAPVHSALKGQGPTAGSRFNACCGIRCSRSKKSWVRKRPQAQHMSNLF